MSPLVNPEQLVNLFSADGVHNYVERHYGSTAGKFAGTTVVGAVVVFCLAVIVIVIRGAIEGGRAILSGAVWPSIGGRDLQAVAIAIVAVVMSAAWLARKIARNHAAVNDALLAFANATKDRLDGLDAHRTEHFEFFSKRLTALEQHTHLPGADPLREELEARYTQQMQAKLLTIHSARYGMPGHENDVTELLLALASSTELQTMVTNKTMGGDPIYGAPKQLKVEYSIGKDQSVRHSVVVPENSLLHLGSPIVL